MDKMLTTPRGMRLHIGIFGRTNVGKSSILNAITKQEISVVSSKKGTTTDPNSKATELLPIGPVVFIDTAGLDDNTELGKLRVEKTKKIFDKIDIALIICDYNGFSKYEKELFEKIKNKNIASVVIVNKSDLGKIEAEKLEKIKKYTENIIITNVYDKKLTESVKSELVKILPEEFIKTPEIVSDLVEKEQTVVLVVPVDKSAPKGRLILPQVQVLRELLDNRNIALVVKESELQEALNNLKNPPSLVITDSQAFKKVDEIVGSDIFLTSFSILFARLKGDLKTFIEGAKALEGLKDGDKIAVLESCTHHNIDDDIATVKLPKLIKKYCKKDVRFEYFKGCNFPENVRKYALLIHCGACMTNRREVLSRISKAVENKVPISNYGIIISKCLGILERAVKIFNYGRRY